MTNLSDRLKLFFEVYISSAAIKIFIFQQMLVLAQILGLTADLVLFGAIEKSVGDGQKQFIF
ncbi:hypothetical protein AU509_10530 [Lonsdalea britannica]|uniref:Uncharacterized protein n=1 Tax=Lonsdalea britannica TaxID=1082704 RepID=A0AAD0WL81_9GAMM|nr:hypothetical protein CKQ53_11795 [Lonsdalea britannica]OSM96751.1 hypothetical protein AU509_10530 [Lonsdalea britannica]OSN06670.1 hypothetical protein AU510_07150 [Lonsdalea britannica]